MRRSLTILFLALLVLLSLTGCSASAPAETTTPPTEAVSFFEEQGLQAWEGFTVEADPNVREIHAKAEIPNIAEVFFYEKEGDTATEIVHKEIIDGEAEVHIAVYSPEEFGMEYISDVVDSFYQKAVEDGETMAKEEWLSAHEDYVVYNCWMIDKANWAASVDTFCTDRNTEEWNSTIQMSDLYLMDGTTGNVFSTNTEAGGIVGRFPLTTMGESAELFAVYNIGSYEQNSETSKNQDFGSMSNMFVMVPKAYDGLIFVYDGYADNRTDEELLSVANDVTEAETSKWETMPYPEYQEQNPHLTQYFFTPAEWDEEDSRPAPAAGNFFDRMGINANMEKFEVTETISETGIKETHWNNSISVPGAEVLYFNSENYTINTYMDKKLANCRMDVYAKEYPASQFDTQEIQDVINCFYDAEDASISKEQWLKEHKNHKLVHFASEADFWVSGTTQKVFIETKYKGTIWSSIKTNWNKLIDRYTGTVFMPQSGSDGIVEDFEVNGITFSVMNTQESEWYQPTTRHDNYRQIYNMYVLVPADYDGLAYSLVLYEENRSDEDIFALLDDSETEETAEETETEEETSTWWSGNFYDEQPHLKRYYFIPAQ